jgi:hypothetical protein
MNDILLDSDGDLQIQNGDFVIGKSDAQNALLILRAEKGTFKQFSLLGVGLVKYLNAPLDSTLRREIQLQMEADGYTKISINSDGATVTVQV